MIDLFLATGASLARIERFLDAEPAGDGTVRDQITADMANQLMEALGSRMRQSAGDVKRIRQRGNWINLDRRPVE